VFLAAGAGISEVLFDSCVGKARACRGLALVGAYQHVMVHFKSAFWGFVGKEEAVKIKPPLQSCYLLPLSFRRNPLSVSSFLHF